MARTKKKLQVVDALKRALRVGGAVRVVVIDDNAGMTHVYAISQDGDALVATAPTDDDVLVAELIDYACACDPIDAFHRPWWVYTPADDVARDIAIASRTPDCTVTTIADRTEHNARIAAVNALQTAWDAGALIDANLNLCAELQSLESKGGK